MPRTVNIAVEDALSEAIIRTLLSQADGKPKVGMVFPAKKGYQDHIGSNGYGYIKTMLPAFNEAANTGSTFLVLVDSDNRPCPPQTIADWLKGKPQHANLIVRIAVREVESWLLADRKGIAIFLGVREECIPLNPDLLKDPKRYIVRLAARSKRKDVRAELAPALNSKGKTGPYYTRCLAQFAASLWSIDDAAKISDSLRRAQLAINRI